MTYREELAGRCEAGARLCRKDERNTIALLLDEAAAALRQSPTVEEVAQMICSRELVLGRHTASDRKWTTALETAARIADLYGRRG
jgi:hypothetical protein